MSHFAGFVILTPKYAKHHTLEDSLAEYDENKVVPEYSRGEVSDFDKIECIKYYLEKENKNFVEVYDKLYSKLLKEKKVKRWSAKKYTNKEGYLYRVASDNKDAYVEMFKELNPNCFEQFEAIYEEHGDDWNGNCWKINPSTGKLEEYSTYNPKAKWDWYDENGRWSGGIKTKSGEYVNQCLLGEIDWEGFKPDDYEEEEKTNFWGEKYHPLKENVTWHFTKDSLPFCIVVDGKWYEKGEMLWFAMTSNEMSNEEWNKKVFELLDTLPDDSQVWNIDFHI